MDRTTRDKVQITAVVIICTVCWLAMGTKHLALLKDYQDLLDNYDRHVSSVSAEEQTGIAVTEPGTQIPEASAGAPPPVEYADGTAGDLYPVFRVVVEVTPKVPMSDATIRDSIDTLCRAVLVSPAIKGIKPVVVAGGLVKGEKLHFKVIKPE